MSVTAPQNTLRYQVQGRPATLLMDISDVPMKAIAKALGEFMANDNGKLINPEGDALMFYMMAHAKGLVMAQRSMDEPLGDLLPVMLEYHKLLAPRMVRMFYYLLIICLRESRHVKNRSVMISKLEGTYGKVAVMYTQGYPDAAVGGWQVLVNNPPDCTLGQMVACTTELLGKGQYHGGYGGKKWAQICSCLEEYVFGRYTIEMMMDTAFTLSHNNGPIFNKGVLFAHYDSVRLIRLLDIQRSGQIPQAIASSDQQLKVFFTPELLAKHKQMADLFGDAFTGKVDWNLVEALGSVQKYPGDKLTKPKKAQPAEKVLTFDDALAPEEDNDDNDDAWANEDAALVAELSDPLHFVVIPSGLETLSPLKLKKLQRAELAA